MQWPDALMVVQPSGGWVEPYCDYRNGQGAAAEVDEGNVLHQNHHLPSTPSIFTAFTSTLSFTSLGPQACNAPVTGDKCLSLTPPAKTVSIMVVKTQALRSQMSLIPPTQIWGGCYAFSEWQPKGVAASSDCVLFSQLSTSSKPVNWNVPCPLLRLTAMFEYWHV